MTPSLFVGSWRDGYAVLVQEFRPTGKPVGRQFMQSKHRLIRNKRTIKTWAAQNGRIHPQRAVSGGGVCPSEFPNQQGTQSAWSNVLKNSPPRTPPPTPYPTPHSPAPDASVSYGYVLWKLWDFKIRTLDFFGDWMVASEFITRDRTHGSRQMNRPKKKQI